MICVFMPAGCTLVQQQGDDVQH